jgi:hypothetical protein
MALRNVDETQVVASFVDVFLPQRECRGAKALRIRHDDCDFSHL